MLTISRSPAARCRSWTALEPGSIALAVIGLNKAKNWDEFRAALGRDRSQWKWGMLHKATFVSNPLGLSGIRPIYSLVNRGPVSTGGGTECVNNNMWYVGNNNFSVRLIPSIRMIVDLGDFDKSVAVNSTGNSGHPISPGYGDQILP